MNSWTKVIDSEALKLVRRFEEYARSQADEERRRQRRTTCSVEPLICRRPAYWKLADGFNPYVTRARAERIGHSVQQAIRERRYTPRNAVLYAVPKVGGGVRNVSVFQVADNAVSRRVFETLMRKNRPRMSSRAYAYRDDISVHDAIFYVAAEFKSSRRVFVAEYDFSKYFDNISHEYLWRIVHDNAFLLTLAEESVINAFLRTPALEHTSYSERGGEPRTKGVPQGTSISLFLANVAAWELDQALERLGVSFVRYADDTLIWSTDYTQLCRAVDALYNMSERIGAPLNFEKSGGIRLLAGDGVPAEIKATPYVDLLGHRLTAQRVSIKPALVEKLRKRINELLYFNLIREPARGAQNPERLAGGLDRDYATLIWQLRRYLYGDISERGLRKMEARGTVRRRFRGFMSFFPLVDDPELLARLDGWLVSQTFLALQKRYRLLNTSGFTNLSTPYLIPGGQLSSLVGVSGTTGEKVDLRLPSFIRIARVIRRAVRRYGPTSVAQGLHYEYT
jgi:RNA-directed DNA polymerase